METVKLSISGMHCGNCVTRIVKALETMSGVEILNVEIGSAEVKMDRDKTSARDIAARLSEIGFDAEPSDVDRGPAVQR